MTEREQIEREVREDIMKSLSARFEQEKDSNFPHNNPT